MNVTITLEGGTSLVCDDGDPYNLVRSLLETDVAGRSPKGMKHVVGVDGSDIYFRRERVVAVGIDA